MADIWVRQLEARLNAQMRDMRIACLNAGVSGLTSPQVLQVERKVLSSTATPQAAVINLASNDVDTIAYRVHLDSIVTTLQAAKVPVVLVDEPNSPERRITDSKHGDLARKHRIIAEIGRLRGVPVVDMQQVLAAKNNTGFLWWDFVHLTSYGQRLFADHLSAVLPDLLHLRTGGRPQTLSMQPGGMGSQPDRLTIASTGRR